MFDVSLCNLSLQKALKLVLSSQPSVLLLRAQRATICNKTTFSVFMDFTCSLSVPLISQNKIREEEETGQALSITTVSSIPEEMQQHSRSPQRLQVV